VSEPAAITAFCWLWMALAVAVACILFRIVAPYGRHVRPGWGPSIPGATAWMVMESPAWIVFGAIFAAGPRRGEPMPLIFATWWIAHYLHRAVIQPWRLGSRRSAMPLSIVCAGFAFNVVNAWLNARWLTAAGPARPLEWVGDIRFVAGAALFAAGAALNVAADEVLGTQSRGGSARYRIPEGRLFRWISCPNYLGEIVEWTGWAVATWSLPGASFAVWTAANLIPRAAAHHRWYRHTFRDYPPGRRALIPGVW
jgi:3-oxo-5-alpha-steroid 4-dehydrogenase 1